jgi:sodium transport system permease protein
MNWGNVRIIFEREVRDQMRDRRTLFMIFVLPLLLYPLLGLSFLRVLQFLQQKPFRVMVVGQQSLPESPPLVAGEHFDKSLFDDPSQDKLLELSFPSLTLKESPADAKKIAERLLAEGQLEAVLIIPSDFKNQLAEFRTKLPEREGWTEQDAKGTLPRPRLIYNDAKENSRLAEIRLQRVLQRWSEAIGRENLAQAGLPAAAAVPFQIERNDIAPPSRRGVAGWSKILPFILLIWALTGAFYPAVDLCAGEKERGTLETLLISPAERSEIVWGKLFTVMLFSVFTAVLNLVSLSGTGGFINSQFSIFGAPPWSAMVWLLIALLPVSAFFSALCLSLAALARSTKEGQYYLMPLMLVITPLVFITLWPGVELTLGFSLIPVTGIVLLLRALLEGEFWTALRFAPPVIFVTLICCHMAIRWAIDQFSRENVLFRESERLDLKLWLIHLWRDRGATPSAGAAVACGALILMIQFLYSSMAAGAVGNSIINQALFSQFVCILAPTLLCLWLFARSPRETLQLRTPGAAGLLAAAALALTLHPAAVAAKVLVTRLYPVSDEVLNALKAYSDQFTNMPLWVLILVFAALPALCEELAFRGFILSGLRHLGNRRQAIVISAIVFGVAHPIQQQSMLACAAGVVLGFLAIHSGNIWTPMLFHVMHNSLALMQSRVDDTLVNNWPILHHLFEKNNDGEFEYRIGIVLGGMLAAGLIFARLSRVSFRQTPEEKLYEAIRHDASSAPVG